MSLQASDTNASPRRVDAPTGNMIKVNVEKTLKLTGYKHFVKETSECIIVLLT